MSDIEAHRPTPIAPARKGGRSASRLDRRTFVTTSIAGVVAPSLVRAQSVADFYRGKTITLYIGYASGGGYDLYARVIARHMGKHIPGNPAFVNINMPGASSMTLANHLARAAPRDGTAIGLPPNAIALEPRLKTLTRAGGAVSRFAINGFCEVFCVGLFATVSRREP